MENLETAKKRAFNLKKDKEELNKKGLSIYKLALIYSHFLFELREVVESFIDRYRDEI
jgi:hypothetical protein